MTYLEKLTTHVECKIKALLPKRFAVVIERWTTGAEQYVAIFVILFSSSCISYKSASHCVLRMEKKPRRVEMHILIF